MHSTVKGGLGKQHSHFVTIVSKESQLVSDLRMRAALALLFTATSASDERRVIGFHVDNSQWQYYDWKSLTTVSSFADAIDPEMVATAHRHGVRVTMSAPVQPAHIRGASSRAAWIEQKVATIRQFGLDGLNIDIEKKFFERGVLTSLTKETAKAVKASCPNCTVAFDLAAFTWFDAFYDFHALAEASDYVVLMAHDMGALDPVATPNTPLARMRNVVDGFLRFGIPRSKLVLGLAWYGYDYPCSRGLLLEKCLYDWPFHVSDHQRGFTDLLLKSRNASLQPTLVRRDRNKDSLTFRYNEADASGKLTHEVWFDDATTLADKVGFSTEQSLAGVAIWDLNSVQYGSSDPLVSRSTTDMWQVLRAYLHNGTAPFNAILV